MTRQKRAMIALGIGAFTSSIYAATQNLLAYITRDYPTVNPLTVVTLMSVPSVASLIVALISGPMAMKISKKLLMTIYTACTCVSMFGFALLGGKCSFGFLMGAAIIGGVGSGGRTPIQNTLVNDLIDAKKQVSFIAFSSALANGGMALCNFVFGWIGSGNDGANWPHAFYFGAALSVLALAAVIVLLPNEKKEQAEEGTKEKKGLNLNGWKPYRALGMMIVIGIFMVVMSTFTLNVSGYIITEHKLGTANEAGIASMVMTVSGMLIGFTYSLWGKLFQKWTATVGFLISIVGILSMMFLTNSLAGIYICGLCTGIGLNLITPLGVSSIMAECPKHVVSLAMSVFTGINFLSVFAAPYILSGVGGVLGGGIKGMAFTGIIAAIAGVVLSAVLFGLHKEKVPEEA